MRLLLLLALLPLSAWGASVTGKLSAERVEAGSILTYLLTLENVEAEAPPFPEVANLSVLSLERSQQTTIFNGRATRQIVYRYAIQPRSPGEYVIPSITVRSRDGAFRTAEVRFHALPSSDSTGLEIILPRKRLFVGETIPLELHLYIHDVVDVQMPQFDAEGFTVGPLEKTGEMQVTRNNKLHQLLVFSGTATPHRAGKLALGPARTVVRRREIQRTSFGLNAVLTAREVSGAPVETVVREVPAANAPAAYGGAIGRFTLECRVEPVRANVGDPITLHITLTGEGNLGSIQPPELDFPGFKKYPPASRVEYQGTQQYRGRKHFEQILVPESADLTEIPGIRFAFFHPEEEAFHVLKTSPMPITVLPAPRQAVQPTVVAVPEAGEAPPLAHIKPLLGTAGASSWMSPWVFGLQLIPPALWLGLLFRRKRLERIERDPRPQRRYRVKAMLSEAVPRMRLLARQQEHAEFYALLFRLLQEQIGERLDLPSGAITEAVVDERLQSAGVPADVLNELHALFTLCNQARYAPSGTAEELEAVSARAERVLQILRQMEMVRA